jgi:pimeloyl-ACP methyl ester carboxylesterase
MVHYRTADAGGHRVYYREAGEPKNPAILLLHGFPTSSHMFRDLIPLLADHYHVIAPTSPASATPFHRRTASSTTPSTTSRA